MAIFAAGEKTRSFPSGRRSSTSTTVSSLGRDYCAAASDNMIRLTMAKNLIEPSQTKNVYANRRKTPLASILQNASSLVRMKTDPTSPAFPGAVAGNSAHVLGKSAS
jgi:hypothetical protein